MPGEEPTESTTFSPAGPVAERPAAAGQPFGNEATEVITVQPSHSATTTTTAFVPSADRQPQQAAAGGGQRDGEEEEEEDADREDGGLAKTAGGECCPDCSTGDSCVFGTCCTDCAQCCGPAQTGTECMDLCVQALCCFGMCHELISGGGLECACHCCGECCK